MSQELRDRINSLEATVALLQRERLQIPTSLGEATFPKFVFATALELINALGGEGDSTAGRVENGRPYAIWEGSQVLVWDDYLGPMVRDSNAAILIKAELNNIASKTLISSYLNWRPADGRYFDATGFDDTSFAISDPDGILVDKNLTDTVTFSVAPGPNAPDDNTIAVVENIGNEDAGDGGGSPGPPGTPGTPGDDGTIANLVQANVDELGHVTAGSAYNFDNAVLLMGNTNPITGLASNNVNIPLVDNQPVLLIQEEGGSWNTVFGAMNVIQAQVNKSGGVSEADATFPFTQVSTLRGGGAGSGTALNWPADKYTHGEQVVLFQANSGSWQPLFRRAANLSILRGEVIGNITAADATFSIDNLTVVRGRLPNDALGAPLDDPADTITVKNDPPVVFTNNDECYAFYDQTAGTTEVDQWRTDPVNHKEMLEGLDDFNAGQMQVLSNDNGILKWVEAIFLDITV